MKRLINNIKLKLFDRYGWFKKEFTHEFNNRGLFNYLCANPQYIEGKVFKSAHYSGMAFWNSQGKEYGTTFPTVYFPQVWIDDFLKPKKERHG